MSKPGRSALGTLLLAAGLVVACSSDPAGAPVGDDAGKPRSDGPTTQSADGGAAPVPSGPPAIAFVGRFDVRDPKAPRAAWPGVRIIARFEGTAIRAKLDEPKEPDQEGPSEWDVVVDGEVTKKLVLEFGEHDYDLASGLPPRVHVVELYKRSEAQDGVTRFLGFDYAGGKLLAPPVRPARRIEIIGDSAASAFGVEGVGKGPDCPGEDWAARWQNFHVSFGARLGEAFDADVHGTVYSGKGFAKNIWRPDRETLGKIYGLSDPLDASSSYDVSSWTPDVVVIMAGGNDFAEGLPDDDGPASLEAFTAAYDALVSQIRTAHPKAHLFLTVSGSLTDAEPAGRETRTNVRKGIEAIVKARAAKGDTAIHSAEPPVAKTSELTGCDGHGSPEYHQRIANDLATLIRGKAGW